MAKESSSDFNKRLTEELLDSNNIGADKLIAPYRGSNIQQETYDSLQSDDMMYKQFITRMYGSYDNFLQQNKINQTLSVFDPTTDYVLDATIITEDASYKTDHLSAQETLMENLSGICSVWFTRTDGSTKRLNCTLQQKFIPTKEWPTRASFFSPMPNDRIGVWDLNEQKWKSFYMSKLFKFVRDDTTGLE